MQSEGKFQRTLLKEQQQNETVAVENGRGWLCSLLLRDFPGGSDGKASVYNAGDPGLIPGLERSPGEGNGNLLQDYCLENPMDRGAWQATVHGAAKSQTRLSDFTFTFTFYNAYEAFDAFNIVDALIL